MSERRYTDEEVAATFDMAGRPTSRKLMGLLIGVGRTVELHQPISEANWEYLVSDLRQTFAAQGKVRQEGSFRRWSNGNLQALLEPTPGGQRLRLQTVNGNALLLMTGGAAALGVSAATLLVVTVGSGLNRAGVTGIAFLAVAGIGMFVAGALRLPGWARRRRTQIDEVTARLISNAVTTQPE